MDVIFTTSIPGILNPLLTLPVQQGFWRPLVEDNGATRWKDPGSLNGCRKPAPPPDHVEQSHEQAMNLYYISPH